VASLTVRDMGPASPELPGPAAGILDLFVAESHRRQGVATFLLGEAFKQLVQQGIGSVEAHVSSADPGGIALCSKLRLRQEAEAIQFRKLVG
jgi:GNAT superfamily N-acetyltransferase